MTSTHHHGPAPGGADHSTHAGHDPQVFEAKFWLSLLLTVPIVVTSEMVMDWFGYELDFTGIEWVGPVLGTIIFFWGGWPSSAVNRG
jgi:Cu2+-exporting ATPase